VVTGPIAVRGAEPGDVLKIEVLDLGLRVPYGVVSSRESLGALPGEYPEKFRGVPAFASYMNQGGNVSVFTKVERAAGRYRGVLPGKVPAGFDLAPFMGIMGVARDTAALVDSVPPTDAGGNVDIKDLVVGSTLYLPVQVAGAMFFTGDPHFAQGDGEVALTAMEASLRATLRFSVIPRSEALAEYGVVTGPLVVTPEYLVPTGLSEDLDEAVQHCVRAAIELLHARYGMDRANALAYLSAATDFDISQVVDLVKGVHARIRIADFDA
jgi:acetamidase/formamidase